MKKRGSGGSPTPNVAAVLREKIQRLARKEVKAQVGPVRKHRAEDRRVIAALRRQGASLEREVARLRKQTNQPAAKPADAEKAIRFSPKLVAADRERLELSAKDYAALVGVSMLTIYNWVKVTGSQGALTCAASASVWRPASVDSQTAGPGSGSRRF